MLYYPWNKAEMKKVENAIGRNQNYWKQQGVSKVTGKNFLKIYSGRGETFGEAVVTINSDAVSPGSNPVSVKIHWFA